MLLIGRGGTPYVMIITSQFCNVNLHNIGPPRSSHMIVPVLHFHDSYVELTY